LDLEHRALEQTGVPGRTGRGPGERLLLGAGGPAVAGARAGRAGGRTGDDQAGRIGTMVGRSGSARRVCRHRLLLVRVVVRLHDTTPSWVTSENDVAGSMDTAPSRAATFGRFMTSQRPRTTGRPVASVDNAPGCRRRPLRP